MTKVKICGITNAEDARAATSAGADLLGFIFYKPSPRYVPPPTVKTILESEFAAGYPRPVCVGVFVDEPLEAVQEILALTGLDAAQLHGDESPEFLAQFRGAAYKALRPKERAEAKSLVKQYTPCQSAENLPCFLLDAYHPTLYGGTGYVTDWTIAANLARQHALMLAGSLTPDNVAEAVKIVAPWGVDVSSGVEAEKGKKDHAKVRRFIQTVRSAEPGPEEHAGRK